MKGKKEELKNIELLLAKQIGRGHRTQNNTFNNLLGGLFQSGNQGAKFNANTLNNIWGFENQVTNPLVLLNTISPEQKALNLVVQNWATAE